MIITLVILGADSSRTGTSRRAQSHERKQRCDGPWARRNEGQVQKDEPRQKVKADEQYLGNPEIEIRRNSRRSAMGRGPEASMLCQPGDRI